MTTFANYLEANTDKEITITFGRFNPPHIGHERLIEAVAKVSRDYRIYASLSSDKNKNPLDYKTKIKWLKKMFPQHARHISTDSKINHAPAALQQLYNEGYTKVNFMVGSDQLQSFQFLIKYNGVKSKDIFYKFNEIKIIAAPPRLYSASQMRQHVRNGDISEFEKNLPSNFKQGRELFNDVRIAMGEKPIREHIRLDKISDVREEYVRGNVLFKGYKFKFDNKYFEVAECKPNFVVTTTGKKIFVNDITI